MGKINLTPYKRVDNMQMTDSQSIRRIESYLYVLNEQLRYELTHIDEDNISGDGLQAAAFAPSALKQAINEQLNNQTIDISDNDTILTINRRLDNLTMLQRQDAQNISANTRDIQTRAAKTTVDALSTRLSGDETTIAGIQALLAQTASAAALAALEERVSQAEIDIDNDEAQIRLKASQSEVDDLTTRVSQAEVDIDGANALIALKASQTEVNELTSRVSQAEIDIDGANAAITLKASQQDMEDVQGRLSQAEIDIDGANAAITLKASQADLNALTGRVSQAEIDIDGANAQIALKASQADVDGLTGRMRQAEIDIDGAEAAIALKASQTDVDGLTERVSQAEIDIDGANAQIALKASQADVDGLTGRMRQAEIDIDGAEAAISLKVAKGDVMTQLAVEAGNVSVSGGNLVVDGYVTAAAFEAEQAKFNNLTSGRTTATLIKATGVIAGSDFTFQDNAVGWSIWSIGSKTGNYLTKDGQAMTVTYADLPHYHTVNFNNGQITIGGVTDTAPGPFDITATTWYKNQIAAAKNSVYVVKNWEENVCTCIPSAGTGRGATITISQATGTPTSSAPNLYPITIWDGNTSVLSFTVNASARYTAGQNSVSVTKTWEDNVCTCNPSAGTGAGKTITLSQTTAAPTTAAPNLYRVTVKDGSTQVMYFTVDASARYTAGVTAGENKFTAVSVTPIGTARYLKSLSITPISTAHSAIRRTGYLRGSSVSVTPIGNAIHFKRHSRSETPTSTYWYSLNASDYDLTYYTAGAATTYYNSGGSFEYYDIGASGTYYEAGTPISCLQLLTGSTGANYTYYSPGTAGTYYTKNG